MKPALKLTRYDRGCFEGKVIREFEGTLVKYHGRTASPQDILKATLIASKASWSGKFCV